jgi:drug/metabolite transporter (DMT)-like permease
MLPILLLILLISSTGSSCFAKGTSRVVAGASRAKYSLFLTVNGLVACFFFWMFSGFSLSVNSVTLFFSAIYAVIVASLIILNMIAYSMVSISGVNIILNGCGLLCTSAVGFLFFSEEISPRTLAKILIMMIAIMLTFIETKRGEAKKANSRGETDSRGKAGLLMLVLILIVIASSANTVTLKCFTLNQSVADENSFFFFTNVFLALGCAIVFFVEAIRKKQELSDAKDIFTVRALVPIVGNTLFSNIGSLVGVIVLAEMDISVYTPISSAIGILSGVAGSLIYREKLGILSYFAAVLALVAVLI